MTDVFENTSPSNLAAGSLTTPENQPIGTVVGDSMPPIRMREFTPSSNGEGIPLQGHGTLKTATVFDYETNASTYSIRVQAKDEQNAAVEGILR